MTGGFSAGAGKREESDSGNKKNKETGRIRGKRQEGKRILTETIVSCRAAGAAVQMRIK